MFDKTSIKEYFNNSMKVIEKKEEKYLIKFEEVETELLKKMEYYLFMRDMSHEANIVS